jgi:hypothetical protein
MEARGRAAAAVTVLLLVGSLTACDRHLFEGPVLARIGDGGVEFMICTQITTTEIFVEEGDSSVAQSNDVIWIAEGEATLNPGVVIQLGEAPSGLTTLLHEPGYLTPSSTIAIALSPSTESDRVVSGEFDFAQLEASLGQWYGSAGEPTDGTCESAEAK